MAQDYQNILDLGGLRTDTPADKIPDRNASHCENIDFSLQGLIQTRLGYRQFANKIEDSGRCLNYFLFRKNYGTLKDIHLRVRSNDDNSVLEYLDPHDEDTGDGKYQVLIDDLEPMKSMGFAVANGDGGRKINRIVMGNGHDDMLLWNGAIGRIDSATEDTIVIEENIITEGFDTTGKLLVDGVEYEYTGYTDKTFTGVTPDASGLTEGKAVAQTVDRDILKENIITGSTIALVTGDPATITDSGNGFLDAGFTAGQSIVIAGSDRDDGVYTIAEVTAGTITLTPDAFLYGETAGERMTIAAGVPKGNILATAQRKLWVSGNVDNESKVYYSQSGNVTCFGITSGLGSGGSFDLIEGSGRINLMESKGKNTIIVHKDDMITAYTREAIDAESVRESFDTIAEGNDVGATNPRARAGFNQSSYYMTGVEGLKNLERAVQEDLLRITSISDIIYPTIKEFDNSTAAAVYFAEKKAIFIATNDNEGNRIVISIYLKGSGQEALTYDISIDSLPVADWLVDGSELYFVSSLDQNTYKMFARNSDDLVQAEHKYTTKEYTFNEPARSKDFNKLFIEGYIKEGTKLAISVLYGVGGGKGSKTFVVKWDDASVVSGQTISALGVDVLGKYSLGLSSPDISGSRLFSVPIHFDSNRATRYKIRFETYYDSASDYDLESYWAVSNVSTNPTLGSEFFNEIKNSNEPSGIGVGTEEVSGYTIS